MSFLNSYPSDPYCNTVPKPSDPLCKLPSPLSQSTFSSTFGLLVFSAILACAAWLGMAAVQNGVPAVVNFKHTFHVLGGLMAGSAFFTLVAVLVFGASNVKKDFCAIFDQDATYTGLFCGYSDG